MNDQFGIVGLGVMGQNLALNVARNGSAVAVYDLSAEKTRAFAQTPSPGKPIVPVYSLHELVQALQRPRRILIMVNAGAPVDAVLAGIRPFLESGDILMDGGNSYYLDTERRFRSFAGSGIHFLGMGVSGGEEGALWGPSLMPGGAREAYDQVEPVLRRISAQTDSGSCVEYMGDGAAGHFVKMAHNGIEYGDMQLIAEAYDLLRRGLRLSPPALAEIFGEWNRGDLESFLIEITAKVVDFPDDRGTGGFLIDRILDSAGQKGTGKWTSQTALDLGVPLPTITAAVDARFLSSLKPEREQASAAYPSSDPEFPAETGITVPDIRAALYASKICSYAQGFALLGAASREYGYGLRCESIARIWKGGCIIRAVFLDRIREAFSLRPDLPNLLLSPAFAEEIRSRAGAWRRTVSSAMRHGIAIPAMSASLSYFDAYRTGRSSANLLQAQRDYFGAHTYQRIDLPGTFHTRWGSREDK